MRSSTSASADFIKGARSAASTKETAEEIFGLIVYFGGYGFNKVTFRGLRHVSYQTAYLKAHYTPEFMAALLSSEIEDGNKRDIMVEHIADARGWASRCCRPDVNASDAEFTRPDGKIVFGLTAIKGLAAAPPGRSSAPGEGGPFQDISTSASASI